MKTDVIAAPCWSTSCFGDAAQTSPMELSALGEHLQHCSATPRPLMRLRCAVEVDERLRQRAFRHHRSRC